MPKGQKGINKMKKNIFKKIVASLATVAMAAGLFTVMPAEEAKAADQQIKIIFDDTEGVADSWAAVSVYTHAGGPEYAGGWSGTAMTKKDTRLYEATITVPDTTLTSKEVKVTGATKEKGGTVTQTGADFVGVDLDAGKETRDLEVFVKLEGDFTGVDLSKVCFYQHDDGFEGSLKVNWPGTEMTLKDGVYYAKIKIAKANTEFHGNVNNGGDTFKIEKIKIKDFSTGKIYITAKADKTAEVATSKPASWTTSSGSTTTPTPTPGSKTPEVKNEVKVEVTLDPSLKWDEVYVHAWGDNFSTKWPGVKMTAKNGKYYATIDTKLTKLSYVISAGDGKDQTIDIADVNGQDVKITVTAKKDAEGKKFVATAAGSKGAANTGDVAPVVVMLVVAMAAASVVIASKKKTICE